MYIGGTGLEGLHHLVWEIFDNSRDEAMGGFCDTIELVLLPGNKIRVADNGRGIPVDIHSKTKVSALETIMTVLHAGGKFGGEGYKVSGGLHGVGASVVNALSEWLKAEVRIDGKRYTQEYKRGKPTSKLKMDGKVEKNDSWQHGTQITYKADPEIFTVTEFDRKEVLDHTFSEHAPSRKPHYYPYGNRDHSRDPYPHCRSARERFADPVGKQHTYNAGDQEHVIPVELVEASAP
jgi:DNA gyrase subunit B